MVKNSLADLYNYLHTPLHNSRNDLFLLSLDSFKKKNPSVYDYDSENSVTYLGFLIADIFLERTNGNPSNFANIRIPALFGKKSNGSLTIWKRVFNNIELLIDRVEPVKGLLLGEYISDLERREGVIEIFPENSLLYLNVFSGPAVYDELIKRNIKDIRPLVEMQEYKIITIPKLFQEYLDKNK